MKKYLVFAVAVLFTLGLAASAYAVLAEIPAETTAAIAKGSTQVTIGGQFRVRGDLRVNVNDFNDDVRGSGDRAYYDTNARLSVEAKLSPSTMGFLQLETSGHSADNDGWGRQGAPFYGGSGNFRDGNAKQGALYILQNWLMHKGTGLLGVPAFVKIGTMPIKVGARGMFWKHDYQADDALLFGVDPTKDMHLIIGTVKVKENNMQNSDDMDLYTAMLNFDIAKGTGLGLNVSYLNGQNCNSDVAASTTSIGCAVYNLGEQYTGQTFNGDIHLWNIGIDGKVNLGALDLYAEFNYQYGKVEDIRILTGAGAGSYVEDLKLRGYAGYVGANFKVNPVTLNLEFAYASGDKDKDNNKFEGFLTSPGQVPKKFTYLYDFRTVNSANNAGGGYQNIWYLKAGATAQLAKSLRGILDVYYLKAVENAQVNTGTFWTAGTDKDIGVEVDAFLYYTLDRNTTYFVEAGYLFAGDFWTRRDNGRSPDDAFALRHGIMYTF